MRNVISSSRGRNRHGLGSAVVGLMMLSILAPAELAAEVSRLDLSKLDNKGVVSAALAALEDQLGLPAGAPHPGAVVVDSDQGTLRWWPIFDGQTFLIEARLIEDSEAVELWAMAGFKTGTSVVEAAGKTGAALLSVTSDKARSEDPWASSDSWSAKLEVETFGGAKETVLARAAELLNTKAVGEQIEEVAELVATGVTEEVAAAYLAFDVLPLVLNLIEDDLQTVLNPAQLQSFPHIWPLLDPWISRGERTTADCRTLDGGTYTISCSGFQGQAICTSSLNPFGSSPTFICSGITDHCRNWREASCWCANQPPLPCQPGQIGPLPTP